MNNFDSKGSGYLHIQGSLPDDRVGWFKAQACITSLI